MIKYNHLDLLNERQLNYIPIHFVRTKLVDSFTVINFEKIVLWIKSKLDGRFFLLKAPMISNNDKLKSEYIVGFEDPKELTYFILACPHIRRN